MSWFGIALTIWLAFGACAMIYAIDKERKPIDRAAAIVGVVINSAIIIGLIMRGV